jgi:hypothetical protein
MKLYEFKSRALREFLLGTMRVLSSSEGEDRKIIHEQLVSGLIKGSSGDKLLNRGDDDTICERWAEYMEDLENSPKVLEYGQVEFIRSEY